MGKIDKFLAKPVEVEIGGEKYMIKPFTVEDLPLLTRLGSKEEAISSKATQEVIGKVMKQIDPEATEDQIKGISVEYLADIMNAVSKVNGIEIDEEKIKLLENANKPTE